MATGMVSDMNGMAKQKYMKKGGSGMAENWIAGAIKKKGALHKGLNVPMGKKIPMIKMEIKESDSPLMKRRKRLAQTLKGLRK